MSCGIIIAAAGQGKRMGAGKNKLFIELDNKPILIHTIEKFLHFAWVKEIVVVSHPMEIDVVKNILSSYQLLHQIEVIAGGAERQDSIENGLKAIESDYVMVHDGARPFIDEVLLEHLYEEVVKEDAVVLGVPVKDTIKRVDASGTIQGTLDRQSLWAIQTPQAFRCSLLKAAYQKAREEHFLGTDDATLVENYGANVKIVLGNYNNIKITTKEDLILAQLILKQWSD